MFILNIISSSAVLSDDNLLGTNFLSSTTMAKEQATGQAAAPHIYKLAGDIAYTNETCSALCYTHNPSNVPCHFFILDSDKCFLGNFESGINTASFATTPTAYYNESKCKILLPSWKYFFTWSTADNLKPISRVFAQYLTCLTVCDNKQPTKQMADQRVPQRGYKISEPLCRTLSHKHN